MQYNQRCISCLYSVCYFSYAQPLEYKAQLIVAGPDGIFVKIVCSAIVCLDICMVIAGYTETFGEFGKECGSLDFLHSCYEM